MNIVNAIAKARFGSAKPQRVQLHKGRNLVVELLCLEPGQKIRVSAGEWTYYVVAGAAVVTAAGNTLALPSGQLAATDAPDEDHTLANNGEARCLCLAIGNA